MDYYTHNLARTKQKLRESVTPEHLIIQAINNISELQKTANLLTKRLREWYALYNPELEHAINDNEAFADKINAERNIDSMGGLLTDSDLKQIFKLKEQVNGCYVLIKEHEDYLERILMKECPNLHALAGTLIGSQLISHAGSLKRLAMMTAARIQLFGAEKAMFRHLKTGSRTPKHGLIIQHPYVASSKNKGKTARVLADKISMAVKVDYFKGEFIADRLKKEMGILP